MAYADRDKTGENVIGLTIASVVIGVLGYALVSGLAAEGYRTLIKKVTAVDIKKDEPKKELPPPPKKLEAPPPIVAPPPMVNVSTVTPPVETVVTPPPIVVPAPPSAPPAPPPPKFQPKPAVPKGNPGNWVTNNDYPTRALREERSGTTGFRLSVGPDGRPTGCDVTSSSGSSELDSTACSLLMRRAKFNPPTDSDGNPTSGSWSSRFRWVIPEE